MFPPRTYAKQGQSVQQTLPASPDLAGYIRRFEYRETPQAVERLHPLAFSVFPFIAFYLGGRCAAFEHALGGYRLLPRVAVVGPCDHRVAEVRHASNYRMLRVIFEPTGFYRLFHISPSEILNLAHDGRDVLGTRAMGLHAQLCAAARPEQMVQLVEERLRAWCTDPAPRTGIELAAEQLLRLRGRSDLQGIASSLGFSNSSWLRHFTTEIGVTPKRYLRVLRFERAIGLKLAFPEWSWTQVCLETGYYDQAHFISDCQTIARCTPSSLMRGILEMPEPLADAFYGHALESAGRGRLRPRDTGQSCGGGQLAARFGA